MRYLCGYERRYSGDGDSVDVWVCMPRIEDAYLDTIIYLYPSEDAANRGEAIGGTGFLMMRPMDSDPNYGIIYAVTNAHVIEDANSPVIRLNTRNGNKKVLNLKPTDWFLHPTYDLAVALFRKIDKSIYKYKYIPTSQFLTHEIIKEHDIGPGDDVFMVGRFVSHEGRQRNLPLVRFGNISMMPYEKIEDKYGRKQKVFLVEMRSLAGFSGSPVFVYLASNVIRQSDIDDEGGFRKGGHHEMTMRRPWLLGVDCADLPFRERVYQVVNIAGTDEDLATDQVAYSNSGQMAVIPSWRLIEFLDQDERFVMQRKEADRQVAERKRNAPLRPNALKKKDEAEGITQGGFMEILQQVSRKTSETESDDSDKPKQ
jgi:hypothetical protein